MKLGVETGSLVNAIMSNGNDIEPTIGMGATELCWSDRHPLTVIDISKTGKTITLQKDNAKRIDKSGMSESQNYEYSRNPNGVIYKARKNSKGQWKIIGGHRILLGKREEYFDFSF